MKNILCLYKPIGTTPLQLIQIFRQHYPEYEKIKLGYAGRLDPMADGLLLILAGDENKKRKQYEDLQKEYECEVLFGVATDTYDILGKIRNIEGRDATLPAGRLVNRVSTEQIQQMLASFLGKQTQPYPPYSSQPVKGKPLYYWARQNKLNEITIPTKEIEIFSITILEERTISQETLQETIHERINKIHGDFRQKEILELWNNLFKKSSDITFPVLRFRISCSSGTYIRSFAHTLGEKLQTGAIALRITRTAIGAYHLQDGLKLDIL